MIGMNFWAFLVLLVAGVIAAVVIHYVLRYRLLDGLDGFLGKCIAGWVGVAILERIPLAIALFGRREQRAEGYQV